MALQANAGPIFTVPYFSLDGASLTIHATDTEFDTRPFDQMEGKERGQTRWYQMQPLDSRISVYWREQLANQLVHKFLFMDPASKSGQFHGMVVANC